MRYGALWLPYLGLLIIWVGTRMLDFIEKRNERLDERVGDVRNDPEYVNPAPWLLLYAVIVVAGISCLLSYVFSYWGK